MKYKVCITAAGIGSRISTISKINKALLPIKEKSILSKIIQKIPEKIEIIIAVGYQKEKIKDFVNIAHSDRNIKIVEIDNFNKKGSGPGYTLLSCKKYLNCPFIFIACDTLVKEKIPEPNKNWIGISTIDDPEPYLVVEKSKNNLVSRFFDKKSRNFLCWNGYKNFNCYCFIGLAGVKNYKTFWESLKNNKDLNNGELQVSNGLDGLKEKKIDCINFTWFDTGNEFNYIKTLNYYGASGVLPKPDEYFYKENNIIIKYFVDNSKAHNRKKRSQYFKNCIPQLIPSGKNFLAYKYEKGKLLSEIKDKRIFLNFLDFMFNNFWNIELSNKTVIKNIKKASNKFYKIKTIERINSYLTRNSINDQVDIINKCKVPKIKYLLSKIDWKKLCDPVPVIFHGDLQPENIVVRKNKFILLDWREDFGNEIKYGDIYYDLAKLHHALIITGKVIRENKFNITISSKNNIKYSFNKRKHLINYIKIMEKFLIDKGFDIQQLNVMSSLIYLNIAPLHHFPYSDLLFYHGKLSLFKALKGENTI